MALLSVPGDAAKLYPAPVFQWLTSSGTPAVGWKVYTYEGGTSTPKDTYTDASQTTPNANPVILNSRGEADIYFSGVYKLVIKDDSDVTQDTIDNYGAGTFSSENSPYNLVHNGSFEVDDDSDGVGDGWIRTMYSGGSGDLVETDQQHASQALKCSSIGNGGCAYTSENYFYVSDSRDYFVSFSMKASVADIRILVNVKWYDSTENYLSETAILDDDTSNPTSWTKKSTTIIPPSGARFAKLELFGAHSSDPTVGNVIFDDFLFVINNWTESDNVLALSIEKAIENAVEYNPIINGNMDIWQRGAAFTAPASSTYTADRWRVAYVGGVVFNVLASTDVPTVAEAGVRYRYSYLMAITTADTSIAAGDFVSLSHKIEGYNFAPFVGKTATLVFWVKATVTGTYCAAFLSSTRDISYVAEFTVNASNTWEKKTITLDFDYSSGTWDYTSGIGLFVEITLAAGSTYHASAAGSWETGNFRSTSNQVNGVGITTNYFKITGVGLYFGDTAPSYTKARSRGIEEMLCNRYFWKSFPVETAPVSSSAPGSLVFPSPVGAAAVAHAPSVPFPVRMRAAPTCVIYNPEAAGSQIRNASGVSDFTGSVCVADDEAFHVYGTTPAGTAVGHLCKYHITADAEL